MFETRKLTQEEKDNCPVDSHVDLAMRGRNGVWYYAETDFNEDGTPNPQFVNNEDGEHIPVSAITRAAAALGRRGGKSTSEAKRAAARRNGRKGGRPRKKK